MTYDQLAARMILSGNTAGLSKLATHAAVAFGSECPECGSHDTEDNGAAEYRCVTCDHRWGTDAGERYGF